MSGWWPKYRVLHCCSGQEEWVWPKYRVLHFCSEQEEWVSGWWPKYVVQDKRNGCLGGSLNT